MRRAGWPAAQAGPGEQVPRASAACAVQTRAYRPPIPPHTTHCGGQHSRLLPAEGRSEHRGLSSLTVSPISSGESDV